MLRNALLARSLRAFALAALVGLAAPLVLPTLASAQYREFTGRIDKINKKKLILDNRMGDKVAFHRVDSTAVSGQEKKSWEDLKRGDWATVSWKMMDKPRKAYKIQVQPPRDEAGEDQ